MKSWSEKLTTMKCCCCSENYGEVDESKLKVDTEKHPVLRPPELWAWWSYDWANSPYAAAVLATFLPLLANDYARIAAGPDCKVRLGTIDISPSTFASSFISFSVLFQVLTFISTGAMADWGSLRKPMLLATAISGSILTISIGFITNPALWWLIGILLIITNVLFGSSTIFYNSYLPLLVQSHPKFINAAPEDKHKTYDKLSNYISGRGIMVGFFSGIIMLGIGFPLILRLGTPDLSKYNIACNTTLENFKVDNTLPYRIVVSASGAWWLFFTLLVIPGLLHHRPSPPLPEGSGGYFIKSLTTLASTLRKIRRLPNAGRFLIVYFVSADTYSTIASIGILFMNDELAIAGIELVAVLVLVPLSAAFGIFVLTAVQRRLKIKSKSMIYFHLVCFNVLCSYVLIGFIPGSPLGFVKGTKWDIFIWAILFGFNFGGIGNYMRSLFSSLIPPGRESEFFSLYAISDKGSSWIGPLICATIREVTGTFRFAMIYLALCSLVSIPILKFVSIVDGRKEAHDFAVKIPKELDDENDTSSVVNKIDELSNSS